MCTEYTKICTMTFKHNQPTSDFPLFFSPPFLHRGSSNYYYSSHSHLDQSGTFIRILLVDFSSAFNTLQTHLLLLRLLDLDVSPSIVLWVRAFLRDRPQTVCENSVKSNELILNTGAPQGCVLSPILFSIYTNEVMSNTTTLTLIKFADDMALVARLKDEQSLSSYFNFIGHLISWLDESYLKLNVKKKKKINNF